MGALVVCLVAASWSLVVVANLVARRHAALARVRSQGGIVEYYESTESTERDPPWFQEKVRRRPSIVRQWMGDPSVWYINISDRRCTPDFQWSERESLQSLFPEACVVPEHQAAFAQ